MFEASTNLKKLIHTLNNPNEKLLILKSAVRKDVKTKNQGEYSL
jgi:hypothetical protein